MAAIRDSASNFTTVAALNITGYLPNDVLGDLLLAIVVVKTTTATVTVAATGWTTLAQSFVSSGHTTAILYKVSTGTDTDPVFSWATTTAIAGVHIIALQDVNTSSPFNGTGGAGTGYRIVTSLTTAAVGFMPQLTTTVDNSLVLYALTTNTAVVPMIMEGPVVYEYGADYSTNSSALSYTVQRTAGQTSGTVGYSQTTAATFTGHAIVLGISPSITGATGTSVIPSYCAGDSSKYISPINGITAYNAQTAFSVLGGATGATGATGIRPFGVTLAGANLESATVSGASGVATDSGLNSYHSMGTMTHATIVTKQYKGALLNVGGATGGINIGYRNILVHSKPTTPASYQNTDGIGRDVTKGIGFGIASGATGSFTNTANAYLSGNWKIWHVHGSNTAFDTATHVPMVVHPGATGPAAGATGSKIIGSTGLLDTTNVGSFGFFSSAVGSPTPSWQFGSMWALDTTVIAGGNQYFPVDTKGMTKAAAVGKERLSVIQQGIDQALVLQPLQFGNGGTDPIYLNLDSSAIEFPKIYDVAKKQVFYNSVPNAAGITYYAGAGDTIIHSNATLISQDKYVWGFDPNTSASATYTFNNTVINGAGIVTLNANVPLTSVAFTNCSEIPVRPASGANGPVMTLCNFNAAAGNTCYGATGTLGASGAAVIINGTSQTDLQTALDRLVSCTFTNNTNVAGALKINYTGGATGITLTNADKTFSNNTYDLNLIGATGTSWRWTNTSSIANASTYTTVPGNSLVVQNTTTFGQITFDSYVQSDYNSAVYRLFYKQLNTSGSSLKFGTNDAVLVKSLSTDLSADGSFEVKGKATSSSVTFNYDYIYNTQGAWVANNSYKVGDQFSNRVGATTTWYEVTTAYTSGSTFGTTDTTKSTVITGPSVVLVVVGRANADYFNVSATLAPFTTTIIAAINSQELNYSNVLSATGTVGTITGAFPTWSGVVTGLVSTGQMYVGQSISATSGIGALYGGSPTSCTITSIPSLTSITYTVTGTSATTPVGGSITNIIG